MRPIYLISKTPYDGVIHIPVLSTRFLHPSIDFSAYEGVVITSKQAVLALQHYVFDWKKIKWIAVSEATAQSAYEAGAEIIEIAEGYGESIPDVLNRKKRGKWLYARPETVASEWVDSVRKAGIEIDEAIVYETACNEDAYSQTIAAEGVLIFTSPSAIRCFLRGYTILPTHEVVVIGKTTQNALPEGVSSHMSPTASVASAVELAFQIAVAS